MKTKNLTILLMFLGGMILFLMSSQATAQAAEPQKDSSIIYIKVWVDGLACPFCAYGLEKKIKKIDGAKDLFIEINEGYVTFSVPTSKKPKDEALLKLVKEAGFEARNITYSAKPFSADDPG